MCVVSMISDHYWEKWAPYTDPCSPYTGTAPSTWPSPEEQQEQLRKFLEGNESVKLPTQAEVDEFHELLRKARQYDKDHNQPHCDNKEKKEALKTLAKALGIDISFIDEED